MQNFWASSFLIISSLPATLAPIPWPHPEPWHSETGPPLRTHSDHLLLFLFTQISPLLQIPDLTELHWSTLLSHHLFWLHSALHPAQFPQFINAVIFFFLENALISLKPFPPPFILSWQNLSTSWTLLFTSASVRAAKILLQKNHTTVTGFV